MLRSLVSSFLVVFLSLLACDGSAIAFNEKEISSVMQKNYGSLHSWEAQMTFPDYPNASVHIWYSAGKWRQEWATDTGATAVGFNGNVIKACTPESFALSPLFVWMVPNPVETWQTWKIDFKKLTYGFYAGQPCLMVGIEETKTSSPALFLNNEDMTPVLVRYKSEGKLLSVAFSDYRTMSGFRVPQKLVIQAGSMNELQARVKWYSINQSESEELYARDALDDVSCEELSAPFVWLRDFFQYPVL